MKDWTLGTFLFWLLVAIVVPGIVIHFALGRRGGHRLFDKDGMSADEVRRLPLDMTKRRIGWQLRGSAAALAALALVAALYPLACLLGLPVNLFGIANDKLLWWLAGVVVLAITLGPALLRKWRE